VEEDVLERRETLRARLGHLRGGGWLWNCVRNYS